MTRPGEAGLGEPGKRRLWRRAGCGGTGGNGGGTVGARRLVPTKRRGKAWGVPGLPEPGGRDGARGDEHALEGWGGGMVGRAGAGRLVLRVMSSAEAAVSVVLLLTLGEAGLGNSDSVLSFTGIKGGPGVAAGTGTAGGNSSEVRWLLTFSWGAMAEKMPDTLK